jgi:hypothetical protein
MMEGENEMRKCVICENTIEPNASGWDGGNNAWPVKQGDCCDTCDETVVRPARIAEMAEWRENKGGKKRDE